MPDVTIASAIPRTSSSLTLHPNLFQVFHPIGGVRASPFEVSDCASETAVNSEHRVADRHKSFLILLVEDSRQLYQKNASGRRNLLTAETGEVRGEKRSYLPECAWANELTIRGRVTKLCDESQEASLC